MKRAVIMAGIITILTAGSHGTDRYVSLAGTNDYTGGYTNWVGAATQIQWAVDAATNGETVLVSNGTYYCSGVTTCVLGGVTNSAMIVITNSITLKSFSGFYTNTIINGNYFAYTNVRGVYMANTGAVLSGFTITNCFTTNQSGAGIYADASLISNCLISGNCITLSGVGAGICLSTGTVSHCIIAGNRTLGSSANVPGIYIINNGRYGRRLVTNCVIANNSSQKAGDRAIDFPWSGGGSGSTVTCSTVSGNIGCIGIQLANGAGSQVIIDRCVISNNASYGVYFGEGGAVRNSLILNNGSYGIVIGNWNCNFENCTIAQNVGYGVYNYQMTPGTYICRNNIIYYNGADGINNWSTTNLYYYNCCTYPIPSLGANNISNAPLFANTNIANYRLSANSPCVNTGINQNWMTNSFDLDGRMRIRYGTVDRGAYERIYDGSIYSVR